MRARRVASVRVIAEEDRLEISFLRGFTNSELAVVKVMAGRRWDRDRRIWSVPNVDASLAVLIAAWGQERVHVARFAEEGAATELLQRATDSLRLRGYSPNTRRVYLAHLRRFLE